ncbi:MAG: integron integrase [Tepidisphaeraceae bacterium]
MRLLDQLAVVARRRRLADTTIDAYSHWVRRFLAFAADRAGRWTHPAQLATGDVEAFLNYLVLERRLAASSQNQALNALVFLYRHVLENVLPQDHLGKFLLLRSKRLKRIPTVLAPDEVRRVIDAAAHRGNYRLMMKLLYGTGLRVSECCTLRVRDIDFGRAQIIVRQGKGDKDRIVMLPAALQGELAEHLDRVATRWRADVARGGGHAPVPDALAHKRPTATLEWPFQFLFASAVMRRDHAGRGRRWYTDASALDRAVRAAALRRAGQARHLPHLPSQLCDPLAGVGYDIRQVQTLLGHASLKITMIYTHVMNRPAVSVTSPLDRLQPAGV